MVSTRRWNNFTVSYLVIFCGFLFTVESLSNWFTVLENGYNATEQKPCDTFPELTTQQKLLCQEDPHSLQFVAAGISLSLAQCQHQFRSDRWNCSTASFVNMPAKATKESAFIFSLTSAAVVHSISRACSSGNLSTCTCANPDRRRKKRAGTYKEPDAVNWKWGGCSDNVNYGLKFGQKFGDAPEEELHESLMGAASMANLYNKKVGRKLIAQMTKTECRCHGASGACALKTCWRTLPSLEKVAAVLKTLYEESAIQVSKRKKRKLRPVDSTIEKRSLKSLNLVYTSRSADFCVAHPSLGIYGVKDRVCNRTGIGVDSCSSLCCGRGYNTQLLDETINCNCKFHWCCHVTCDQCSVVKEVFTCK